MTRFKLTPWLAIPALLLLGPMMSIAIAATPDVSLEEGLIYLPLEGAQALEAASPSPLTTSLTPGEATIAQRGAADALVANRGRYLAVRFEPPFAPPFTISSLSFASRVQIPNAALPFASFRSVRLVGADAAGAPDKSQTILRVNRYLGSNTGASNVIPVGLNVTDAGKVFFAIFEFPTPTSGVADTFPFLFTDRDFHDQGLFLNSFASDTSLAPGLPPAIGTLVGTTQLMDQNVHAELTCTLTGSAPFAPPNNLGLNLRTIQVDFGYANPAPGRVDGTGGHWNGVELVRRDGAVWTPVALAGAGAEKFELPALPSPGTQIYAARTVSDQSGPSWVSNVTITGNPGAVVGMGGSFGEDADEPNGKDEDGEATPLILPVFDRAETIWPAGDEDNFTFLAHGGDIITATATPTNVDFRNDLDPVVLLLGSGGDPVAIGIAANPGEPASLTMAIPKKGDDLYRYFVKVVDRAGSLLDPPTGKRALVPPNYNLTVDIQTPAALRQFGPEAAPVSGLLDPDQFAFANAGANPVRGNATFSYVIPRSLASGASVKLRIYDVRGRMVQLVDSGNKAAGTHFASWSGHDSRGNRVASGPYFARLDAGSFSRTVRVDLVK